MYFATEEGVLSILDAFPIFKTVVLYYIYSEMLTKYSKNQPGD